MSSNEPIDLNLHSKFKNEQLRRKIMECNDLILLRKIATELLDLYQKESAIAVWSTKRALKAEQAYFKDTKKDL